LPSLKKLAFNSIYRLSEGKENLSKNMETFEMCDAAKAESNYFNFSEGMSTNGI
jgi:hypothetical protein